jgi:dTMP kinase
MPVNRRPISDTERAAAARHDPTGWAALRSILRIRPFRRLWIVLGIASLGDWLGLLATSIFAQQQVQGATAKGVAFGGVIAVRLAAGAAARAGRRGPGRPLRPPVQPWWSATSSGSYCSRRSRCRPHPRQPGPGIAWTAIATFLVESVTMAWLPAKDASVPNLLPRGRLETANQLTLATTYGITPVAAPCCSPHLPRAVRDLRTYRPDLP